MCSGKHVTTGYITCVHVMDGAPPSVVEHPTAPGPIGSGWLLCRACGALDAGGDGPPAAALRVVCVDCARRHLLPNRVQ